MLAVLAACVLAEVGALADEVLGLGDDPVHAGVLWGDRAVGVLPDDRVPLLGRGSPSTCYPVNRMLLAAQVPSVAPIAKTQLLGVTVNNIGVVGISYILHLIVTVLLSGLAIPNPCDRLSPAVFLPASEGDSGALSRHGREREQ